MAKRAGRPPAQPAEVHPTFRVLGLANAHYEYQWTKARRWRFDWAWPRDKVALEIEGGVWVAGRHVRGKGFLSDMEKYNEAQIAGWVVIRVTPDMVADGRAATLVRRAVDARLDGAQDSEDLSA